MNELLGSVFKVVERIGVKERIDMGCLVEQLTKIFASYTDSFSVAIFIAKDDSIIFSAANGFANRDFHIQNTVDTRFDTASVTKAFTAVATLSLIEKGSLKFSDKITKVIDLHDTKIPTDVTIEHLLTHTSGIADDADEEAGEDYAALFVNKPNYSIRNCSDFLPQFAYKEPIFKAGTNVRYNNCAFVLLGLAIEKVTGINYREYVTENIFNRCGMEQTCFQAKDEICPDTAEGYYPLVDDKGGFVKWKKNIYSYPPIGTPDSGAYTTVSDLHRFWMGIWNNILLPSEYSRMLTQPQCAFSRPHKYGKLRFGYAFEFIEADNEIFCIYKDGINNGVAAMLSYYPQLGISMNILANQKDALWALNSDMRNVIRDITTGSIL